MDRGHCGTSTPGNTLLGWLAKDLVNAPTSRAYSICCKGVGFGLGRTWEPAWERICNCCFQFPLQQKALLERVLLMRPGFSVVFDFAILSQEQKDVNTYFWEKSQTRSDSWACSRGEIKRHLPVYSLLLRLRRPEKQHVGRGACGCCPFSCQLWQSWTCVFQGLCWIHCTCFTQSCDLEASYSGEFTFHLGWGGRGCVGN